MNAATERKADTGSAPIATGTPTAPLSAVPVPLAATEAPSPWRRLLDRFRPRRQEVTLRDTLEELIEDSAQAEEPAALGERALFANIIHLRSLTARDVMVPRADIVAVEATVSQPELLKVVIREAHSRLPVYRETLDDVLGMIHIKDLLAVGAAGEPFQLRRLLRPVLFVAPSMRVMDLLLQMRVARIHLALVVDEYGGIDGLVTIEDLVEEIVGEIDDEHDVTEPPKLQEQPDGSLLADARTPIDEFEQRIGSILSDEERADADTLGGLVVLLAGRVPGRGEVVRHGSGLEFDVLDADPRRVKHVRVRNLPRPAPVKLDLGA
ncbi:MAG: HlyC/CorC family transporter [Alphaproteobacteria bacterium]|nr:HlyC/CorC family transporter [Alphaproteobacteria bacterium]